MQQANNWRRAASPKNIDDLFDCLPLKPRVFRKHAEESATFSVVKLSGEFRMFDGVDLNYEHEIRFISFDVDHDDIFAWKDVGLPTPLIVVRNKTNARHHITWELAEPVLSGMNSRKQPRAMLKLLRKAIAREIDADPSYSMVHTKNPFNIERFNVIWFGGKACSMSDLASRVDLDAVKKAEAEVKRRSIALDAQCDGSRNKALFNDLRLKCAYRIVSGYRETNNYDAFLSEVAGFADELNASLDDPLKHYEVSTTAKSVAFWTWHHYSDAGRGNVKMMLSPKLSLKEKQAAAASFVSKNNSDSKKQHIIEEMQAIIARGETPSRRNITAATGFSKNTVKKHFDEALEAALSAPKSENPIINFEADENGVPLFLIE